MIHPGIQFQILYPFKDELFVMMGELIFMKPLNFLGVAQKPVYRKHVHVFYQISTQCGMKSFGSRAFEKFFVCLFVFNLKAYTAM